MTSYAFIVGINDYQNLPHLMGAVNDANAFYDWLLDTGEVPTENIFRITSANNALLPTIDNIERELKNNIINRFEEDPLFFGNRLYIFLSGHGFDVKLSTEVSDPALMTIEAQNNTSTEYIRGVALSNWFITSKLFREIILIMDCCRVEYSLRRRRDILFNDITRTFSFNPKFLYIFSTQYSKVAKDPINPDDTSKFTKLLLKGLNGEAKDRQGNITSESLTNYLSNLDKKLFDSFDNLEFEFQEPSFLKNANDIIIRNINPITNVTNVTLTFIAPTINRLLIIDSNKTTICEIEPGLAQYNTALNKNSKYALVKELDFNYEILKLIETLSQETINYEIEVN